MMFSVYVLSCKNVPNMYNAYRLYGESPNPYNDDPHPDRIPWWFKMAEDFNEVYYVGHTNDVERRINQHADPNDQGGADFTAVYNPNDVISISPGYETRDAAKREEHETWKSIMQRPSCFVYTDLREEGAIYNLPWISGWEEGKKENIA